LEGGGGLGSQNYCGTWRESLLGDFDPDYRPESKQEGRVSGGKCKRKEKKKRQYRAWKKGEKKKRIKNSRKNKGGLSLQTKLPAAHQLNAKGHGSSLRKGRWGHHGPSRASQRVVRDWRSF